jgi:hypothetical protein
LPCGESRTPTRSLADVGGDAVDHLEQEPRAILDIAAIGVAALVAAVLQELIEKESVGAVDFDGVEPGGARICGGLPEAGYNSRQFACLQRSRCLIGDLLRRHRIGFSGRRDRRRRDGQASVGIVGGVRPAAVMHDLQRDASAVRMYSRRNEPPALDLFGTMDSRHVRVAVTLYAAGGGLGEVQPRRGALTVIFGVQGGGNAPRTGPHAGQCRHDNPIRKMKCAELERPEEDIGGHESRLSKKGVGDRPR